MPFLSTSLLEPEQAHRMLQAMYPLMDELATIKPLPSRLPGRFGGKYTEQGIERERWILWRFAEALGERANVPSFTWERPGSRYPHICGRLTLKEQQCQRKVRWGKTACGNHITPSELAVAARWQEAVHLPFPRITKQQVEDFGPVYWDRMARLQRQHVEKQERQRRQIARDLLKILATLQKGPEQ